MLHFIVNLNASSGKGREIWDVVNRELKRRSVEHTVYITKHRGHARQLVTSLTTGLIEANQKINIVAIGGDGTINEVVNGIVDFSHTIIGYIPAGSGNDLARGLGIQTDPVKALEVILKSLECEDASTCTIAMDVGVLRRNGKENRFAVSTGIGFDAAVCHQVQVSRLKKILNKVKLGKLTYVAIALDRIFSDAPTPVEVTFEDGSKRLYPEVFFIAAMNTPFEGGGLQLCPEASCVDGLLDVIIVTEVSRLSVLFMLPKAMKGKHIGNKAVEIHRVKKIELHAENPMMLHTDGEPLFLRKDMEVEIIEQKMRVIT